MSIVFGSKLAAAVSNACFDKSNGRSVWPLPCAPDCVPGPYCLSLETCQLEL